MSKINGYYTQSFSNLVNCRFIMLHIDLLPFVIGQLMLFIYYTDFYNDHQAQKYRMCTLHIVQCTLRLYTVHMHAIQQYCIVNS